MHVPFAGSLKGTVRGVANVSLHGDVYFDVLFEPDGAAADPGMVAVLPIRVPAHAAPPDGSLAQGRRVEVSFLMQQVTGVKSI